MSKTLRDGSKANWTSQSDRLTFTEIELGAILRIADAVEEMAKPYLRLLDEQKWRSEEAKRHIATIGRQQRQIAGLRGFIKRKNKKNGK